VICHIDVDLDLDYILAIVSRGAYAELTTSARSSASRRMTVDSPVESSPATSRGCD